LARREVQVELGATRSAEMGGLYTRHLLPAVLVVCLALGLNAAPLADGGGTVAAGHAHATLDGTAPAREAITPHGSSHAQPVHAPASEHAPTHISAGVHAHALAHAPEHAPAHAPADEYENAPVAAHAPVHAAHRSAAEVDAELAERAIEDALLDEMEMHREEHLALDVVLLVMLLALSLVVGALLHHHHIYWMPESGATILIGFFFGLMVRMVDPDTQKMERKLYFDPEFFNLFLLPPIIFESGYALDQFLFFRNLGTISTFAVVGTLISTSFTWVAIYNLGRWNFFAPLNGVESGAFACLISAVDPVATLATFSSLKVDPHLSNLIFGESVLNDAVSLILFRSVLHYGVFTEFSPGIHLPAVAASFVVTALGSILFGIGVALLGALLLKMLGLGREGRVPSVEMSLFWTFSYISFVGAEVPHLSGIVSSLFCGLAMRRFAAPNLSPPARKHVDRLLKVMATVADTTVFLLVGLAVVVYIDELDPALVVCTIIIILIGRALNIFPLAILVNGQRETEKITSAEQTVMWWSGLRGAIAVALACEVPGAMGPRIVSTTIFVVMITIFAFGGTTKRSVQN